MTRRGWLASTATAALWPRLAAAAPAGRLAAVELYKIPVNHRGDWLLVRLRTDQGLTGIGDASHGRDANTAQAVREIFHQMRGKTFSDIEPLRNLVKESDNTHSRAAAMSAIEQAMWDIAGQAFGVPAYNLFGGALRTSIRNYANINRCTTDRTPTGFSKWAEHAVRHGFDAIKLAPYDGMPKDPAAKEAHTQQGTACAKAVRATIGDSREVLIDAHSHFTVDRGVQLAAELAPLRLFWLEEVCRGIPELARIHRAAKMPTAGGESIYGTKGFYPYITGNAVDIVMPDIKYGGGLLELKKIAAMADGAGLQVSPHGPASPVGNIAAAHVCATIPNFLILEFGYGEVEWRAEVIEPAEQLHKGHIQLTDKPGFGVRLNDRLLQQRAERLQL